MTCTCEICGKKIVGGSHKLRRHQQSKKCEALRNKVIPSRQRCPCEHCGTVLVHKNLKNHYKSKKCIEAQLKEENLRLLEENRKLKLRKKSAQVINNNTTNNNNIQNTINNIIMTPTSLKDVLTLQSIRDVYTNNHFHDKGIGVAEAVLSILNKHDENRYICTDPSRNICKFINLKGKEIKDVKSSKLWKVIREPVKTLVKETTATLNKKFPESSQEWINCAQPIINADVLPPQGFSKVASTATGDSE